MELELSKALEKFKAMVEKDLTGLAAAWSMLKRAEGDLIVQALLLEKRCGAGEYVKVWKRVTYLEVVTGYPGNSIDFRALYKRALSHRKSKLKSAGGVKSKQCLTFFFCELAGLGHQARGAASLGVRRVTVSRMHDANDMEYFLKDFGDGGADLLGCRDYLRASKRLRSSQYLVKEGFRPAADIAYFSDLCVRVFLQGKRVNIIENGRYSAERASYRELTAGHSQSGLALANTIMTPLCRFVHSSCFGPVEKDIVTGLDPLSIYVLDRLARALPPLVHNFLNTGVAPLVIPRMPSEDMQATAISDMEKAGKPLPSIVFSHQGRSVRATRYDHLGSKISSHAGRVDRETLGLRGRLDVLSESTGSYVFTPESLDSYRWFLCDKEIALIKRVHLDMALQKDVAAEMGITQGAVSHRLAVTRTRIRLLSGMGRMPNEMEISALAHTYLYPVLAGKKGDHVKILMALVHTNGKQSTAACLCGVGQPCISGYLKSYAKVLSSLEIPPDHIRAATFVLTTQKYPYAFQEVVLPHYPWNNQSITDNQEPKKTKKNKGTKKPLGV